MSPLGLYLSGVSLSSLAMGIQVVLIPWLVVGVLALPASQVGWVQASVLLPNVLFLLGGGYFADRKDGGIWMPILLLLMALVHLLLMFTVSFHQLALPGLLLYGVMLGCFQAFMQPLRESMLPRLSPSSNAGEVQRVVVTMSLAYFIAQAIGHLVAGQIDLFGARSLLCLQAASLILAAGCYAYFGRRTQFAITMSSWQTLPNLSALWQHKTLRQVLLLVAFNGFVHMGVYIVVIPVMAKALYDVDATLFAFLQLAFILGGVVATLVLWRRGLVEYPGRSLFFCLLYSGLLLLSLAMHPQISGLLLLLFLWGVVAATSATLSKSLVQQLAPDGYRGRVMSVYQLAIFGMAPLGALVAGYGASHLGPLVILQLAGVLSIALFIGSFSFADLWRTRLDSPAGESSPV